jgi:hypothetical protein
MAIEIFSYVEFEYRFLKKSTNSKGTITTRYTGESDDCAKVAWRSYAN